LERFASGQMKTSTTLMFVSELIV